MVRHAVVLRRLAVAAALAGAIAAVPRAAASLPSRLSDEEYWRIVDSFSETSGYFQSDNLVSNERLFQNVVPALQKLKRGGVYLGVAPDQNFTYILGLEPKIAFIVDIRRGNLLVQMMYKALFELSQNRVEFIARLFARPKPAEASVTMSARDLFEVFRTVPASEPYARETFKAVSDHLTKTHGFKLSEQDLRDIEATQRIFVTYGPELTYSSSNGRGGRSMPTFADLQSSSDFAGVNQAYLGSEEKYRAMKAFEEKNLLVPIVGDFAGTKALRAVGKYLTERGATVSVFYTSNVEQYLFQNGVASQFYANVSALPLDENSQFLRSARGADVLDPINAMLKDYAEGKIRSWMEVTQRGTDRLVAR